MAVKLSDTNLVMEDLRLWEKTLCAENDHAFKVPKGYAIWCLCGERFRGMTEDEAEHFARELEAKKPDPNAP